MLDEEKVLHITFKKILDILKDRGNLHNYFIITDDVLMNVEEFRSLEEREKLYFLNIKKELQKIIKKYFEISDVMEKIKNKNKNKDVQYIRVMTKKDILEDILKLYNLPKDLLKIK